MNASLHHILRRRQRILRRRRALTRGVGCFALLSRKHDDVVILCRCRQNDTKILHVGASFFTCRVAADTQFWANWPTLTRVRDMSATCRRHNQLSCCRMIRQACMGHHRRMVLCRHTVHCCAVHHCMVHRCPLLSVTSF